jgi:hypothetical protein
LCKYRLERRPGLKLGNRDQERRPSILFHGLLKNAEEGFEPPLSEYQRNEHKTAGLERKGGK